MTSGRASSLALRWVARETPLAPEALVAPRGAIARLHARLVEADDAALARLRGVATEEGWIVLGPQDALPWVDGLTYLARDPDAPSLWVPTYLSLSPAATLVERAIRGRFGAGPLALYGAPPRVVALGGARVLDRARLAESARVLGELPA